MAKAESTDSVRKRPYKKRIYRKVRKELFMYQTEKVRRYIEVHGFINREIALNELYVYNLPEVVRKLRAKGVNVVTIPIKGKTSKYCRYEIK